MLMPASPRICAALCLLLVACAASPARQQAASAQFVVVRHAEKARDDPRDPNLTEAGRRRATALAAMLDGEALVATYTTPFRRTRQTAQPAAVAHSLEVAPYSADAPAAELAATLRRDHATGTVLVVGHSNTVPSIVSALCSCAVAPIGDDDYGNVYRVRFAPDGTPALEHGRY